MCNRVPILALVDSDPHGLEILSTYKYGSAALSFDRHNLSVPRIEWIGVKGSEWDKLGIDRGELLSLGAGDRKKALGMLKRNWWPEAWK
jgi:meiotic recombination protein SPO11